MVVFVPLFFFFLPLDQMLHLIHANVKICHQNYTIIRSVTFGCSLFRKLLECLQHLCAASCIGIDCCLVHFADGNVLESFFFINVLLFWPYDSMNITHAMQTSPGIFNWSQTVYTVFLQMGETSMFDGPLATFFFSYFCCLSPVRPAYICQVLCEFQRAHVS